MTIIAPPVPSELPLTDARWASLVERDATADFLYAVITTGIFCRVGCASRLPHRSHVRLFGDGEQARRSGYRACLRCRPEQESSSQAGASQRAGIAAACRIIENAQELPALADLANAAGLSVRQFQRLFRAQLNTTPAAYARGVRAARLRGALNGGDGVLSAAMDAGFGATSSLYRQAGDALGMAPARYRAGGPGEVIRYALGGSTLGLVLIASTARGLCAILLGDDSDALVSELHGRFPAASIEGPDSALADALDRVIAQIEEPKQAAGLPLDIRGTAFQQRVWAALQAIPPGETRSYAQIATAIGAPAASRAVAGACAANKLAIVIPCHRVVRGNGDLSGYRWGVGRKRALLERERK